MRTHTERKLKNVLAPFKADLSHVEELKDKLSQSEERYRTILDQMQESYYEVDLGGNYTFVSESGGHSLGYSCEEMIGRNYRLVVCEEEIQSVFTAFNEVYRTGKPNRGFPHSVRHKDGSIIFAEVSIDLKKNNKGDVTGFKCVSRDITGLRQMEEELRKSEGKYRLVAENARDIIWTMDMNLQFTYMSPAVLRIRGYTVEEVMAQSLEDIFTPTSLEIAVKAFEEELALESMELKDLSRMRTLELEHTCKDGSTVWVEINTTFLRDTNGRPTAILGVSRDITERKRVEEALKQSEKQYRDMIDFLPIPAFEVDAEANLISFNQTALKVFGYSEEDYIVGINASQLFSPAEWNRVEENLRKVIQGTAIPGQEYTFLRKDGSTFVGLIYATPVIRHNKPLGVRGAIVDITERKQMQLELENMATHDFLTGLPNRMLLNDRFQVALAQANRNNYKLGIMSLDLDHFKEVNDTMGHAVGDQLLKAVGARLSNILRSSDTVARLGGDEFLLLLQDIHCPEDAIQIAEKIIDSCKEPLSIGGHQLHISTSIGIAIYPDNGKGMDTLMRKSDAAMYFSKWHGGMQYKVFTPSDQLNIRQS
ncbi:MAG: sensor domain-containing protein [Dehalococcoidia bacterium]